MLPQARIDKSAEILRLASDMSERFYERPLMVCYSGGKDSDVLLDLCETYLEPDKYIVQHSLTTVDAPPTIRHIKDNFKRLEEKGVKTQIDYHENEDGTRTTMWNLIAEKGIPPTRLARYCCSTLKETSTPNAMAVLGVRGGESSKRQGRDVFGVRGGHTGRLHFFHLTTHQRSLKNLKFYLMCGIAN